MKDHMDREYDAWESGGEVGPEPPLPRVRMSDRQEAARAWRDYFLSEGIDALSVKGWDLGETLVMFSPENQVTAIGCEDEDDRPLARNAAGSGAAVFLVNDRNEVLLLKRGMTAPWMPGKWNLPGGTVDPGETPIEAAVRETQEEVSVTPRGLSILSVTEHDWGTLHLYVSRRWTGDLKMTWESSDMRWVPIKQAVKFDLVPGILEPMVALERLLR
jgi:mutator protein MutT